ncbi:cytochrome c1 [Sphingosinicella soli]|uniref:Cytochrome c1 n=1 Tax=Sphingosinicella soli TaxID=333708 RepID=A0A7W7B2C1_9SPHN|nr:cytochrome c1 [Sphingosinicella soli]MBB4632712.1 ubiquinol-cytochrome c reductase cytochrome c1 subunit [Sphingosinicella soli]
MVRLFGIAIGAVFCAVLLFAALAPREAVEVDPTYAFHKDPKQVKWSSAGIFGTYDRVQLQRGFQVYKEVCASCHSLNRIAFRNLAEIGFSEPEVKAIAKNWVIEVPMINPDTGEAATRPGIPSDKIPLVYANEVAARAANNNALPPDLSLITKARHDGSNYLYSLLSGYADVPANFPADRRPEAPLHYNPYFHSLAIAMAPPLSDGQVTYAEGQPEPTVDQMSQDVAAFLTWAAEPKMESRKRAGVGVIVFLLFLTGLAYMSYRRVWAGLKH